MPKPRKPARKPRNQSDLTPPKARSKPKIVTPPDEPQPDRRTTREHDASGRFEPFTPTDQQRITVCLARAMGAREEDVALFIDWPRGISVETLKKHFPNELALGKEYIDLRATGRLVALMNQGEDLKAGLGAIKWWTINKMGWQGESLRLSRGGNTDGSDGGIPADVTEVTFRIGSPMDRPAGIQPPAPTAESKA